jgi:hypothetical protein
LQAFCVGHQPHDASSVHAPHVVFEEQMSAGGAGGEPAADLRMMIWYDVQGQLTQPSLLTTYFD